MSGKRNRTAGHNYERVIAKEYREVGFTNTVTSRLASQLYDSANIDLVRLPLFPQCKYGYKSMSVNNYIEIFRKMEEGIKSNSIEEDHPKVIHHRRGQKKYEDLVIMPREDYFKLINLLKNNQND